MSEEELRSHQFYLGEYEDQRLPVIEIDLMPFTPTAADCICKRAICFKNHKLRVVEPRIVTCAESLRHEAVEHKPPSNAIIRHVGASVPANLVGEPLSDRDSLLDAY